MSMDMRLHIGDIILPVNPSEVKVQRGRDTKTETVDGVGETSHHNGTKLRTIQLSNLLLPAYPDDTTLVWGDWQAPETLLTYFDSLVQSGESFHVTLTESYLDGVYTLDEFDYSIEGGEPDDYYVDLTLKEYREGSSASGTVSGGSGAAVVDTGGNVVQDNYNPSTTVSQDSPPGDNLTSGNGAGSAADTSSPGATGSNLTGNYVGIGGGKTTGIGDR